MLLGGMPPALIDGCGLRIHFKTTTRKPSATKLSIPKPQTIRKRFLSACIILQSRFLSVLIQLTVKSGLADAEQLGGLQLVAVK
jgi:hypothetical protein